MLQQIPVDFHRSMLRTRPCNVVSEEFCSEKILWVDHFFIPLSEICKTLTSIST
uniref:Uncharacterized protein n=1 Tax=Anguilla anguilla TaxID=7936 RepID=A0A0E9Q0B7_ANGAN